MRLVLGMIPMLLIAGFVEGFVSPTDVPPAIKFLLAAGLGTLLTLYLCRKPLDENVQITSASQSHTTATSATVCVTNIK